ncbi:MAG: ArsR family transcriptional regulator [Thermoplasmata archaeon]
MEGSSVSSLLNTRQRILRRIETNPGTYLRELERDLGIPLSTLNYHLRFLEKNGLVTTLTEGGRKTYFIRKEIQREQSQIVSESDKRIMALARQTIPLRILLFLLDFGSASLGDISSGVGASPSRLSYHLNKMSRCGIVRREGPGRKGIYDVMDKRRIAGLLLQYDSLRDRIDDFADVWLKLSMFLRDSGDSDQA